MTGAGNSTNRSDGPEALRAWLDELFVAASEILNPDANPAGMAGSDAVALGRVSSVRTLEAQATMLIESAGDHLSLFVKAAVPPAETVAPWTCLRAALECCAIAGWLLDDRISPMDREARSLSLRHHEVLEQKKFADGADLSAAATQIQERAEEIEQEAERRGHAAVRDRNGRVFGAGVAWPGSTYLVNHVLGMETMYRALSAVVHGNQWATRQLGFRESGAHARQARAGGFAAAFMKEFDPVMFVHAGTAVCVRGFGLAIRRMAAYRGRSPALVESVLERHRQLVASSAEEV